MMMCAPEDMGRERKKEKTKRKTDRKPKSYKYVGGRMGGS